jgi:hypothetical protein
MLKQKQIKELNNNIPSYKISQNELIDSPNNEIKEKTIQLQEKYDKTNLNNKLLNEKPEENLINKKEEKVKIDSYDKFINDIGKDLIIKETQREIIGEEEEDDDKEAEEQRIEEIIKETSKLQIINNEHLDEYNNIKISLKITKLLII